jgi:hypothetical protein
VRPHRPADLIALLILVSGCSGDNLQRHADQIQSLRATTMAVADSWLHGDVSGIYALTAFEETFQLVAQERAAVAATPADLARPAANDLARTGEQLSRAIAALTRDVRMADGAHARRHLSDLEATTPQP